MLSGIVQIVLAPIDAVANLIIMFLAFDNAPSVITNAKVPPLDSVTCSKPAIACCTKFKFVLVLSPHVPAFSPVTISSSFRSAE